MNPWSKEAMSQWMKGFVDDRVDGRATLLCWATSSLSDEAPLLPATSSLPLIWATSALSCFPAGSFVASATQVFHSRSCPAAIPQSARVALWSKMTFSHSYCIVFRKFQLQFRLPGASQHHWRFSRRSRANAFCHRQLHSRSMAPNQPRLAQRWHWGWFRATLKNMQFFDNFHVKSSSRCSLVLLHILPTSSSKSASNMSTLRGSCGRRYDRCLVEVLTLGGSIFLLNFRIRWLLYSVHVHFDCAGSRKVWVAVSGSIWGAVFPWNKKFN